MCYAKPCGKLYFIGIKYNLPGTGFAWDTIILCGEGALQPINHKNSFALE